MYILNRLTEWRGIIMHRVLLWPSHITVDEPPDQDQLPEGTLVVRIGPPSSEG